MNSVNSLSLSLSLPLRTIDLTLTTLTCRSKINDHLSVFLSAVSYHPGRCDKLHTHSHTHSASVRESVNRDASSPSLFAGSKNCLSRFRSQVCVSSPVTLHRLLFTFGATLGSGSGKSPLSSVRALFCLRLFYFICLSVCVRSFPAVLSISFQQFRQLTFPVLMNLSSPL